MDASWEVTYNEIGAISVLFCMRCRAQLAVLFHLPGAGPADIEQEWEDHYSAVAQLAAAHTLVCQGRERG